MKLGLKLWSTNVDNYLGEAKRLFVKGVYDYLELYVPPETSATLSAWKRLRDETGLPFVIHAAHSQQGVNLSDPANEARNLAAFGEAGRFADALAAETIVAHGGWYGLGSMADIDEVVRQLKLIGDRRVIIENKPFLPVDGTPRRLTGSTPDEIAAIVKGAGCGFCLDIDHAIASANGHGDDWREYLKRFLVLSPAMFHISDIDIASSVDQHRHFGAGSLPVREVVSLLPRDARVSIETVKDAPDRLDDFEADVAALRNATCPSFTLRRAEMRDMKSVFDLSNDPAVRANSFNSEPIAWETHVDWYTRAIVRDDIRFFIVESPDGKMIGQVRFQRNDDGSWTISISIAEAFRGKGLGVEMVDRATEAAGIGRTVACIKSGNLASQKMFLKAGFTKVEEGRYVR